MPYGFFTIEQFKPQKRGGMPRWIRITHTQRQIWAERKNGKLTLKKWHAGSLKVLARTAKAFIRHNGRLARVTRRGNS